MSTFISFQTETEEIGIRVPGSISEEEAKEIWIATRPIGMYGVWGIPIEPQVVRREEDE